LGLKWWVEVVEPDMSIYLQMLLCENNLDHHYEFHIEFSDQSYKEIFTKDDIAFSGVFEFINDTTLDITTKGV